MIFDDRDHRNAYRSGYRTGFCTVRCGDVTQNSFFDNPYDFDTQKELFCYWQLGFEDAYDEELNLIRMLDNE